VGPALAERRVAVAFVAFACDRDDFRLAKAAKNPPRLVAGLQAHQFALVPLVLFLHRFSFSKNSFNALSRSLGCLPHGSEMQAQNRKPMKWNSSPHDWQ